MTSCTFPPWDFTGLNGWNIDSVRGVKFDKDDPELSTLSNWQLSIWRGKLQKFILWPGLQFMSSKITSHMKLRIWWKLITSVPIWWRRAVVVVLDGLRDDLWRRSRTTASLNWTCQTKPPICICNPSATSNLPIKRNHLNTDLFWSLAKWIWVNFSLQKWNLRFRVPCLSWVWDETWGWKAPQKWSSTFQQSLFYCAPNLSKKFQAMLDSKKMTSHF